jgi:hypothetical protein
MLFALTLIGVAVFHRHTLQVALTGLAVIVLYKLGFTGFKTGPGFEGFLWHMQHEWVILTNLLCLLVGFALLSNHFEKSHLAQVLPRFPAYDPFLLANCVSLHDWSLECPLQLTHRAISVRHRMLRR